MASSTAQPLHLHCRSRPPPSDQQTMVSSSAPPLHLHCRSVPHRWTSYNGKQHSATSSPALQVGPAPLDSSPKVVFLGSHKLFVNPVESSCRLCRRASCTAQGFGGLLYLQDHRSKVGLKIWPPRPAPASLMLSLRGVLWRLALYVHSS
jgi:hypothetical protein